MDKIKYSNFESIKDIMDSLDLGYDKNQEMNKQLLFDSWEEVIGKKISSVSKLTEINDKGILKVSCANSFVANELFLSKKNIIEILSQKTKELNIEIKDLNFEYKNWIK